MVEEHEEYADELLEKEESQLERVEPVSKALSDMGAIWKLITTKLDKDSVCYICKRALENDKKEQFDIIGVPENKVDAGLVAFVSVCKKCNKDEVIEK